MRVTMLAASISLAALWPGLTAAENATAGDGEARGRLVEEMQTLARDFCRKMHDTEGSLHPKAIAPAEDATGPNPDLMVDYRGIRCAGVDDAPLKQGGFCGLTMEGMKCKIARFSYRDGQYVEVAYELE